MSTRRWTTGFSMLALGISTYASAQEAVVSRLFAATDAGAFISYSWGEHWTRLRPGLRGFTGPLTRFVCLGPSVFAGGPEGVFVSDDYGENFAPSPGWVGGEVTRFLPARLFALEPTLFAGTARGLARSLDGGTRWQRVAGATLGARVNDLAWPGPELFVGADDGLYRSVDRGETFERVGEGLPAARVLALAVSRFFAADPIVFVGTAGKGLYRSRDGAERFEAVPAKPVASTTITALFWWRSLLIVGTENGLFLSEDAGDGFEPVAALSGLAIHSILIPGAEEDGFRSDIILGTSQGVFKSSDGGGSFRHVTEGMGTPLVVDLATFPPPPQRRERR